MHKHLEKMGEVTFDNIFNQKLGEYSLMCNKQNVYHFVLCAKALPF